jgi:hypothetical protein
MSEIETNYFKNPDEAEDYIEAVREHYRLEHAAYKGNRDDEQKLIAEVTSDEARYMVDGVMLGILALGNSSARDLVKDYEHTEIGGHTWRSFRGEFERLLVGFGVITNRLERDGYNVPSYADLKHEDRMQVASQLFSDFLSHNALRFGVDGSGVTGMRKRPILNDKGRRELDENGFPKSKLVPVDIDIAKGDDEIEQNMANRGYATGKSSQHPAVKISPAAYRDLRQQYPEMDKDDFDRDVGFFTNAMKKFAERE